MIRFWLRHWHENVCHRLTKSRGRSVQSRLWLRGSWSKRCRQLQSTTCKPELCQGWGWSRRTDQGLSGHCYSGSDHYCCWRCCHFSTVAVAMDPGPGESNNAQRICQRCRHFSVNCSRLSTLDHWRWDEHSCYWTSPLRSSSSWTVQHSPLSLLPHLWVCHWEIWGGL